MFHVPLNFKDESSASMVLYQTGLARPFMNDFGATESDGFEMVQLKEHKKW